VTFFPPQIPHGLTCDRSRAASLGRRGLIARATARIPPQDGWKKIHNGKIHKVHFSSNIIRVNKSRTIRRAGYVACTERRNYVMKGCLLGSPKLRWDDDINETDFTVTECETVDPAHLVRYWNQWRGLVTLRGSSRAMDLDSPGSILCYFLRKDFPPWNL
jgi:hypothetical protein